MFGNPVSSPAVRRSKYLEDAINGMQQGRDKNVYNTAFGTNASILADAILAFSKRDADNKADAAIKADNDRLTAAIMGTPMDTAKTDLAADKPFDLTPAGMTGRVEDTNAARLKAIAEIGGPMAALQYQQGQEQQNYMRGRDATADKQWDLQFGFQKDRAGRQDYVDDRGFGYQQDRDAVADNQWGQQFDFQQGRAEVGDQQWGAEFGESKRQFDERMAAERAAAAQAAALKQQEIDQKTNGSAVFEGPQLASIYKDNMGVLDQATQYQGTLDLIANTAQQFIDQSKDWGSQGEGLWNDIGQALSMETSDLKALTNRIAPLMRQPGSGASSDKDVEMFQSSVVNINNTPDANRRFADGATAMARRNQQYVDFLTQTITPQDPQSRQKAQQLWNIYKSDQPIYLPNGEVNKAAMPFDQWLAENMGETQAEATEQAARAGHAGAILGGTGQFNPVAFQGLTQPGLSPDEQAELDQLRRELGR